MLSLLPFDGHVATADQRRGANAATLQWRDCNGGGAQCARLAVSLDDTVSGGPTIDLALVRARARDRAHRIGSLVVNPGGPGASGVAYVLSAASTLPSDLRDRFDVVGFDPRGVGGSAPVDCTDNLDPYYALDWSATGEAAYTALVDGVRQLVTQCEQADGAQLPYLGTQRAARDLDRIRAALGDRKLTYLGYSYGTYLGAWYAEQFPDKVRALVLDGAVDPALDNARLQIDQAVGFERSLDLFLADCARDRTCAFHRGGRPGRAYDQLRRRVAQTPIPVSSGRQRRTLNRTRFDIGVIQLLYAGSAAWSELASALDTADRGNASDLLSFADFYTGRDGNGSYDDTQEAFLAISCADGPPTGDVASLRAVEQRAAAAAPRLGPAIVNASLPCALWPVTAPRPRALHASGAPPILVLGTRHDPATPLAWAKGLASELRSGILVEAEGTQHTAFGGGNRCVDPLVVRYLVELTVPKNDTRC